MGQLICDEYFTMPFFLTLSPTKKFLFLPTFTISSNSCSFLHVKKINYPISRVRSPHKDHSRCEEPGMLIMLLKDISLKVYKKYSIRLVRYFTSPLFTINWDIHYGWTIHLGPIYTHVMWWRLEKNATCVACCLVVRCNVFC